ncbi:MAG: DUF1553 domain-containing protein [Planctomycetota bacterium]|nr:DUF1553 domain-containing protein [Planctomycetota bacterium]
MKRPRRLTKGLLPGALLSLSFAFLSSDSRGDIDYLKEVKPLLKSRCYVCHGSLKQKSSLRLDTVQSMLKGGKSGPVFKPGDASESILLKRISTADLEERMPPEHEGEPFSAEHVKLIKDWILQGAPAPADEKPEAAPDEHWAFKQPASPPVPAVANTGWIKNPIDAFIARQHEQHGLAPQHEASRMELLRRLYLDLVGLPPTAEEIVTFEQDTSKDWYETVVDRLLKDPRHGERWARHWMDVWRYSDWWGLGMQLRNSQEHMWHWRDWIVESLNEDTPYDEMVSLMLAADELHPNVLGKLRATGFLARNYFLFNRNPWLEQTVEHVSKGLLGLTMNCAKCHDHKYDPITQTDFYRMRAFFEPYFVRMDIVPGEADLTRDGIPRVFDGLLDAPTYRYIRGDEYNPDKTTPITPGLPELLSFKEMVIQQVALPEEAWEPVRQPWVLDAYLATARKKVESAEAALEKANENLEAARKSAAEILDARKNMEAEILAATKLVSLLTNPEVETVELEEGMRIVEKFETFDKTRWKTIAGEWVHQPGSLEQKLDGDTRSILQLVGKAPQDFDVSIRFRILGGSRWRSVGLTFDASHEDPTLPAAATDSAVIVYASAVSGGSKVQGSYSKAGNWVYPSDAMRALPIKVEQDYTFQVQARGNLVNVSLDGAPVLAWQSPLDRREGAMQLITFDALVVFHEFSIAPLSSDVKLQESVATPGKAPTSLEGAKSAVVLTQGESAVAEQAVAIAKAEVESIQRRADAMRASWTKPGEESEREKTAAAVLAERKVQLATARHTLAVAELKLLKVGGKNEAIEKEVKQKMEALEKSEKSVAAPVAPGESYARLVGAKWTPTRFKNSGSDDPAVKFPPTSTGRRKALADWITDSRNPLTARVAVNHIWMRHLGTPLVTTVFDFGRKGTPPTHPELLDWLAIELVENGWSMKHLHRLIVTSSVYRMSSSLAGGEGNIARDQDNHHLWRRPPIRLEAQVVRDSVLALSGQLDLTMGGPPVPSAAQESSKRRSLYFFHSNNDRNLFLTMFDEAMVKECYQRDQSIVPQQALALSNGGLIHDATPLIAARLVEGGQLDDAAFIRKAFNVLLCIAPSDAEIASSAKALEAWRMLPNTSPDKARSHIIWALLNHNDFITLR